MIKFNLVELMKERGLTNKSTLAPQLKMSRNSFSDLTLKTPNSIHLSTIDSICRELGVTPNELFTYTEDEEDEDTTPDK